VRKWLIREPYRGLRPSIRAAVRVSPVASRSERKPTTESPPVWLRASSQERVLRHRALPVAAMYSLAASCCRRRLPWLTYLSAATEG